MDFVHDPICSVESTDVRSCLLAEDLSEADQYTGQQSTLKASSFPYGHQQRLFPATAFTTRQGTRKTYAFIVHLESTNFASIWQNEATLNTLPAWILVIWDPDVVNFSGLWQTLHLLGRIQLVSLIAPLVIGFFRTGFRREVNRPRRLNERVGDDKEMRHF
ncbi:hypothetical protein BXZ70DRAFT_703322 [Cristinia sonorae]|uniref:Uncharacterized protein n=1 Tax=Cristinia sonorae TaxID=1940300 RepID=A0A8K0UFK7_9AGAR|nr:hypothetical protein BXZ70DRAFT_703322 [Cristinia sonorae]